MAKMTKREALVEILAVVNDADLAEFVEHEIELIDKRKSASRKPTKAQLENVALKANIVEVLGKVGPATATDVAHTFDTSVQKASQLLRQLIAEGAVEKTPAHGKEKATFSAR